MFRFSAVGCAVCCALVTLALIPFAAAAQSAATPAAGYTIHVSARHLSQGSPTEPVHHFCKVMTQDPIIVCLLYDSNDPNSALHGVEYIVAKKLTRSAIPLGTWNSVFHDHKREIDGGNVTVHDLPPAEARKVADLVATTDGLIFHLWPHGDAFPNGTVVIDQAVGHKSLTEAEYRASRMAARDHE